MTENRFPSVKLRFLGGQFYTILGAISVIIWGAAIGVAGSVSRTGGTFTSAGLTYLIAGGLSLVIMQLQEGRGGLRAKICSLQPRAFCICLFFFLMNLTCFWAALGSIKTVEQIPEIGVVNYLWPALTLLLSIPLLGRRARWSFFIGVLLAFLGGLIPLVHLRGITWLAFSENFIDNPVPYIWAFAAAVGWGMYSNLTKRLETGLNSSAVAVFLTIAGIGLYGWGMVLHEQSHWTRTAVCEILFLGIGDAAAYVFWDIAMRKGDNILVASISYFTPIISTAFTCYYFSIAPGISIWLGSLLVIAGAMVCRSGLLKTDSL